MGTASNVHIPGGGPQVEVAHSRAPFSVGLAARPVELSQ